MTDIGPPEVRAFVASLPDDWATVIGLQGEKGNCIESARLATTVLPKLGVPCTAMACDVIVSNRSASDLIDHGVPLADWPPGAWSVGVDCDYQSPGASFQEPERRRGFGGHLVVVGDGWFLDATAPQFARPRQGIVVLAALVGPYDPEVPSATYDLPRGGTYSWRWRPEVKRWRTTPAWRQDISRQLLDAMTDAIARRMEA